MEAFIVSGFFPILRWGKSGLFPENPAKVQGIFVSHKAADFLNGAAGTAKQLFCLVDSNGCNVLHGSHAHILSEAADKPADAHVSASGVFFNGNGLGEAFVEKMNRCFHLLLIVVLFSGKFKLAAADFRKKLFQVKAQQFLKAGPL